MTTSTVTPEIASFAEGVRAALADLPADEVDDLTEGLEADLAESLAEDLRRTLPDPVAYAAELRAAAGLPGRAPAGRRDVLSGLADSWRETRADLAIAVRRSPALAAVLDFVVSLRPAWWLTRAWVAYYLLATGRFLDTGDVLPFAPVAFAVFVLFVVVSVQWGRGQWHLPHGMAPLLLVGNVIAALLLFPAASHALDSERYVYSGSGALVEQPDLTGVYLNGTEVTNIFGYDEAGRPLADVQLFDQDGNPLATAVAGANGCVDVDCTQEGLWVPSTLRNGVVAWNVFPMRMIDASYGNDDGSLRPDAGASPRTRVAPFERVPALVSTEKVAKSND